MKKIPYLILILSLLSFLLGCEGPEGPQGPAGTYPIIVNGYLNASPYDTVNTAYASLYISKAPSIATVTINDTIIPFYDFFSVDMYYRDTDFPISRGDSAHLFITYSDANGDSAIAWSDIILPGDFEIITPDTDYIDLAFGSDIEFVWTSSIGAEAYNIGFSFSCTYYDTSGLIRYSYRDLDSSPYYDTSITYTAEEIFPAPEEVDSLAYGGGHFSVNAFCGPCEEGMEGNVLGDAIGFFTANTYGGVVHIDVVME